MKLRGAAAAFALVALQSVQAQEFALSPEERDAVRTFESHVRAVHSRHLARAATDAPRDDAALDAAGDVPTAMSAAEAGPEPAGPVPSRAPRFNLQHAFDRMSVSGGWTVSRESWQAGIRLRYARSVEFDAQTASYALVEALEIAPAVNLSVVGWARPSKVVSRRTGFATFEEALWERPSRWLFFDRPNRIEEARSLPPGTEVTMSNETRFSVGVDTTGSMGAWPVWALASGFLSGEYFVRIERLPPNLAAAAGGKEWVLSAGGILQHGVEAAFRVRTPEIVLNKKLRVFEARARRPSGFRFLQRAGPQDLGPDSGMEEFFKEIVSGAAIFRFSDAKLFGRGIKIAVVRPDLGVDLLDRLRTLSKFYPMLEATERGTASIPYTEAVTRFGPRAHGDFHVEGWALLYGFAYTSAWYGEDSLVRARADAPRAIRDYAVQTRWDRGWIFFPRESRELGLLTLQDVESGDLFTEVSYQVEDTHAHLREGREYRRQILEVVTPTLAAQFPMRAGAPEPPGARTYHNELPDLWGPPGEDERVSIYVQLILGPRFHQALAGASTAKSVTKFHKSITKAIRRGGGGLDELVRTLGTDQVFVTYRIALTPHDARKDTQPPTAVFVGACGDPDQIPGYRRLRTTFEDAGMTF